MQAPCKQETRTPAEVLYEKLYDNLVKRKTASRYDLAFHKGKNSQTIFVITKKNREP